MDKIPKLPPAIQDQRAFNKGRPPLPEGTQRKFIGFTLPPETIAKIKRLSVKYKSQPNVIVEAIDRMPEDES